MLQSSPIGDTHQHIGLSQGFFQSFPSAIMVTSVDGLIVDVNPAFESITGYLKHEVLGRNASILALGSEDHTYFRDFWDGLRSAGTWEGELWNRRKDGEAYPKWLSVTTVFDESKTPFFVAVFSDISQVKAADEQTIHFAYYDALTGLPNRLLITDRLNHALDLGRRNTTDVGLLYFDLDGFKPVNDRYGHGAGDAVLKEVAVRWSQTLRSSDSLGRIGGDEFLVVIDRIVTPLEAKGCAHRMLEAIEEPMAFEGQWLSVSASVGIATFPAHGTCAEELISAADSAMYQAKRGSDNRIRVGPGADTLVPFSR